VKKIVGLTFVSLDGVMQGMVKRLFAQLVDSKTSPSAVIVTTPKKAGDMQTGSF
jgi:hypothetical protein